MKKKKLRFVFAGGGTGGHIYPGLAIADELRLILDEKSDEETNYEIIWFGNSSGMDKKLVLESASVDSFVGIPSGKLRRYVSIKNFFDAFKIVAGFFCSLFALIRFRPVALFSKGGFVSVPPCVAARLLKIPVLTHECDFTPGLATKINARFAKKILVSYKETLDFFPQKLKSRVLVTGNPVRPAFYSADKKKGLDFLFSTRTDFDSAKPILLVLGGSLGARQINVLVAQNIAWLTANFNVVHQCGANDEETMPKNVSGYFLHPFIYKEMPDVISCADVVLSRAGANSIWECAVLAKPLVLIPLSGSGTRGDQVDNAKFFEKSGAAKVLLKNDVNDSNLKAALESFLESSVREAFSKNSHALAVLSENNEGRPAKKIASILLNEINGAKK